MKKRTHPDELTIAYLAIGGEQAWAEATENQRQRASDGNGGHLGYVHRVVSHALTLDSLVDAMDGEFPTVFVYDIAEPYGKLMGHAILNYTAEPVPRAFLDAFLARDRVENGA